MDLWTWRPFQRKRILVCRAREATRVTMGSICFRGRRCSSLEMLPAVAVLSGLWHSGAWTFLAPRWWTLRGCTSVGPGDVGRAKSRQLGGSRPNIATCQSSIPRSSTAAPLHGSTQPLERHHRLSPRCDWPVDGSSLQLNAVRPHTRTAMPVGPICYCRPERPERIVKQASGGPVSQLLVRNAPPVVGFSERPKPIAVPLLTRLPRFKPPP
jgi:hypothetical protein